ncbi:MAG: META domain-containing protein [Burkholderiales bacterium]
MNRAVPLLLMALVVTTGAGCSSWLKALEDWRARGGGSRPYATLEGTKWEWHSGTLPRGAVAVPDPRRYTVEFLSEHRVAIKADCNRGQGAWTAKLAAISVGPVGYTKSICAGGSLGLEFARLLEAAQTWFVRDGSLYLELPRDRGMLRLTLVQTTAVN